MTDSTDIQSADKMSLEKGVDALCADLVEGMPTVVRFAVTGEEYITLTSGGIHHEKIQWFKTAEEAVAKFLAVFADYIMNHNGHIYWRMRPRLERRSDTGQFIVYSRVLISSFPPLNHSLVRSL